MGIGSDSVLMLGFRQGCPSSSEVAETEGRRSYGCHMDCMWQMRRSSPSLPHSAEKQK